MPCKCHATQRDPSKRFRKASPTLDVKALAQLGADEAARQGLRAIIREGRRSGLDTVQVAGVVISSSARPSQPKQQQQPKQRRRRPKSAAQKEAGKEKFEQKRIRRKLFAVLPIINRVMGAHARAPTEEPALQPMEASTGVAPASAIRSSPEPLPMRTSAPAQEQVCARGQEDSAEEHGLQALSESEEQQRQIHQLGILQWQENRQMEVEAEAGAKFQSVKRDRHSPAGAVVTGGDAVAASGRGQSKSKLTKKVNFDAAAARPG